MAIEGEDYMNFKELNILKSSRNASFLSFIGGISTILNLPKLGLITNIILGVLIIFAVYALTITALEQQKINMINKNEEIKEVLSNFENAKEERDNNIFFAVCTFILTIILISYSIKVNNLYMELAAVIFLLSSLYYLKTGILYNKLTSKCVIEKTIMQYNLNKNNY